MLRRLFDRKTIWNIWVSPLRPDYVNRTFDMVRGNILMNIVHLDKTSSSRTDKPNKFVKSENLQKKMSSSVIFTTFMLDRCFESTWLPENILTLLIPVKG